MLGALVDLGAWGALARARRRELVAQRVARTLGRSATPRPCPAPLLLELSRRRLGVVRAAAPPDAVSARVARFARRRPREAALPREELRALAARRPGSVRDSRRPR